MSSEICKGLPKQEYVVGFIFSEDKKQVALIRKNRPEWQAGLLNGVGGKIDNNESPISCMSRECQEETNAIIPITEWNAYAEFFGDWGKVYVFSTTFDLELLESPESEKIEIHQVNDLTNQKLTPNVSFLIPMALTPTLIYSSCKTQ
jgi:8-oxo-dGTP diphosphatase